MIIGVDCGHTLSGKGTGAQGIVNESVEVRKIGKMVVQYLKELGHTVVDCTVDKSNQDITDRVNKANAQHLDLFISIHLNAFDGSAHGTEILTANGQYMIEADRVLKNIEKLGYFNRKIKNGTSPRRLGVVNSTKARAMLIECFFCDNRDDVAKYNPDTMARAIVEGVTGQHLKPNNSGSNNKGEDLDMTKEELNKLLDERDSKLIQKIQNELIIKGETKNHWADIDFNELNDFLDKNKTDKITKVAHNDLITRGEAIRISNLVRKATLKEFEQILIDVNKKLK